MAFSTTISSEQNFPSHTLTANRIASIDILRGLIIVIMALDHVRDYYSPTAFRPEDVTQTTALLFFTRWITHFCAPVFVFLSGVSIFLYAQRKRTRKEVSVFLLTRGLWLVLVELVVISFFMQLSYNMILLTVFWMFGWSMILLAGLIWAPRWLIAAVALVILAGHNLLPAGYPVSLATLVPAFLYHSPFLFPMEKLPPILAAYTILPWFALMAAGYVAGHWFTLGKETLNRNLLISGVSLLIIFVLLRALNVYGDPTPWTTQPRGSFFSVMSFLNVNKYPPSLLFLSVTIGVAMLGLILFNKIENRFTAFLKTYGEVPFFFFVVHIPLITVGAWIWTRVSFGKGFNLSFTNPADWPAGYAPDLARTYLVWILIVALLYYPCRWFSNYRKTHKQWWLSYL
jgi:uncharacterized membrane protein